jgi:hypothetical protein
MSTAAASQSQDIPAETDKRKRLQVRGKLKRAVDLLIYGDESGKRYDHITAARAANYHPASMRKALELPHVIAYLRKQKQVFRESVSGANIHVLREIRDDSGNAMARLGAVKLLEDDGTQRRGTNVQVNVMTPGVMVDLTAKQVAPLIDHQEIIELNPLEDQGDVPHDM